MSKDALVGLKKIKELFRDKGKWTSHAWARDATGRRCWGSSPLAVCWCLGGAMSMTAQRSSQLWAVRNALIDADFDGLGIIGVNDIGGYDAVMILLDIAIEREGRT